MIFHENRLLADDYHEIPYHIFLEFGKMSKNMLSGAVVIGTLRVKRFFLSTSQIKIMSNAFLFIKEHSQLQPKTHADKTNCYKILFGEQLYPDNAQGLEVIKLSPCSTQLSTKFILLINVKMPTIVVILTFISMINTTPERLKARNFFICRYFSFNEQLEFCTHLS